MKFLCFLTISTSKTASYFLILTPNNTLQKAESKCQPIIITTVEVIAGDIFTKYFLTAPDGSHCNIDLIAQPLFNNYATPYILRFYYNSTPYYIIHFCICLDIITYYNRWIPKSSNLNTEVHLTCKSKAGICDLQESLVQVVIQGSRLLLSCGFPIFKILLPRSLCFATS